MEPTQLEKLRWILYCKQQMRLAKLSGDKLKLAAYTVILKDLKTKTFV